MEFQVLGPVSMPLRRGDPVAVYHDAIRKATALALQMGKLNPRTAQMARACDALAAVRTDTGSRPWALLASTTRCAKCSAADWVDGCECVTARIRHAARELALLHERGLYFHGPAPNVSVDCLGRTRALGTQLRRGRTQPALSVVRVTTGGGQVQVHPVEGYVRPVDAWVRCMPGGLHYVLE